MPRVLHEFRSLSIRTSRIMSSTRRSIFAERNQTSEELLNDMESLSEMDEISKKNKDWKKAVTEEIRILGDHHGELASKQADLVTEHENLSTLCQQCTTSCATNHENILKLHRAIKKNAGAILEYGGKDFLIRKGKRLIYWSRGAIAPCK